VLHGTGTFEEVPPSAPEMAERMAQITTRGLPYLVAERAGGVAGFACAGPYRPRSAYRFTLEDSVYVAPDQCRAGFGRALLAAVIAASRTSGAHQMMAVIGDSANTASIGLHADAGFQTIGTARGIGYKFGGPVDVVYMQKTL
ncbi:MAG: N-acetyltransferase family protein, partial [Pseudomonadota bacterium]